MGRGGWRRAFCTSAGAGLEAAVVEAGIEESGEKRSTASPNPRSCAKLSFFSGGGARGWSNPSTPRLKLAAVGLRVRTKTKTVDGGELQPHTPPAATNTTSTPTSLNAALFQRKAFSTPSSPRSPSRFALFNHLSRRKCRICSRTLKNSQETPVFTAECSHAFHFPCIADIIISHGSAACPVCSAIWQQAPLLYARHHHERLDVETENGNQKPKTCRLGDKNGNNKNRVSFATAYKVYDDDEPLLDASKVVQGGAVRFNPIPEAANEEKDEEEAPRHRLMGLQVSLAPQAALLSEGRRHRSYAVALKVKAPFAPHPDSARCGRTPMDLVTVLDVSQGMTGDKLEMLKREMRLLVSSLGPADRLSVVAFSAAAGAKRLLPLRRMTRQGQRAARQMVERLVAVGGAAQARVGDALKKAAKVLEDRRERNPVATVMLLSDAGQHQKPYSSPNGTGSTASSTTANTSFAHLEIPVCGAAKPVEDTFIKCVGGLASVLMQDALLELVFPSGEIYAVYQCGGGGVVSLRGRSAVFALGDLYAGEERELLIELKMPASLSFQNGHRQLSLKCNYRDPSTQERSLSAEQIVSLPPLEASPSASSQWLRNLFVSTRAVAESRRLAGFSDNATARRMLSSARSQLLQSELDAQSHQLIQNLDAELAELQRRRQRLSHQQQPEGSEGRRQRRQEAAVEVRAESLTPTSAWRAAEQLAKVAIMRKSMNRVGDLHGLEDAWF